MEFAFIAPVVLLFLFTAVTLFGAFMTQNTLIAAARHGCRVASLENVTSADTVEDAVEDRLSRAGVNPGLADIDLSPSDMSSLSTGDSITVTVVRLGRDKVRLGIEAPSDMVVLREELDPHEAETPGRTTTRGSTDRQAVVATPEST